MPTIDMQVSYDPSDQTRSVAIEPQRQFIGNVYVRGIGGDIWAYFTLATDGDGEIIYIQRPAQNNMPSVNLTNSGTADAQTLVLDGLPKGTPHAQLAVTLVGAMRK